jgi:hypothetical protein
LPADRLGRSGVCDHGNHGERERSGEPINSPTFRRVFPEKYRQRTENLEPQNTLMEAFDGLSFGD